MFAQALQGLPGYGGSENGIGIGLGLQQLAQARAQAQFSAQQCALASGIMPSNGMQHMYQAGNGCGSKQQDMARAGMSALPQTFTAQPLLARARYCSVTVQLSLSALCSWPACLARHAWSTCPTRLI